MLLNKMPSLLILDGLEPVQEQTDHHDSRIRDVAIASLLRCLAFQNKGLCVITSRLPVSELAVFESTTLQTVDVSGISESDGEALLRDHGVIGESIELRQAAREVAGHCLTLQLLGSLIHDEYRGDIHARRYIFHLIKGTSRDAEHAFQVMSAYERSLGKESLEILYFLSLFDRPVSVADIHLIRSQLVGGGIIEEVKQMSIYGIQFQIELLRRAKLVLPEDGDEAAKADVHPLVREFFAMRFSKVDPTEWINSNRGLSRYFANSAPKIPMLPKELDPLLRSIVHATRAGDHYKALHEIYNARIMCGETDHAVNHLTSLGAVVSALSSFFEEGNWKVPSPVFDYEDRLFLLEEAGRHLTALHGYSAGPVGDCYSAASGILGADDLSEHAFNVTLGLTRFHRFREELTVSGHLSHKLLSMAKQSIREDFKCAAQRALCTNYFYTGEFEKCSLHAEIGYSVNLKSADALSRAHLDLNEPKLSCRGYYALAEWFLGRSNSALAIAEELKIESLQLAHGHTTTILSLIRTMIFHFMKQPKEVRLEADKMRQVSTENGFFIWRTAADFFSLWSEFQLERPHKLRLQQYEHALQEWRLAEARLFSPYWYGMIAESAQAICEWPKVMDVALAGLKASKESGEHWWDAELFRLQALAASHLKLGPTVITKCLLEAQRIAKRQKTPLLELRALICAYRLDISSEGKEAQLSDLHELKDTVSLGGATPECFEAEEMLSEAHM